MKEFNLEEYKENPSQKVITRDGRAVRIICTDYKGMLPIIALIAREEKEDINSFYENGRDNSTYLSNLDLFFAPIKREGWVNLYKDKSGVYPSNFIFETEKRAKEVILKKHTTYLTTIKIEWEE